MGLIISMKSRNELMPMFLEVLYKIQYGNLNLSNGLDSIIPQWINEKYNIKLDQDEIIKLYEIVQELKTKVFIVKDPSQISDNFIILTRKGKEFYESGSTTIPSIPFDQMNFHPTISKSSQSLYESGHYDLAIFEAFKAVNNFVKNKSEKFDLDGKSLMSICFNTKSPILKFNDMKTESEKNEQEGFMHLFMGAMHGIRNPLGHDQMYFQANSIETLEYLSFASLLIRKTEEAN